MGKKTAAGLALLASSILNAGAACPTAQTQELYDLSEALVMIAAALALALMAYQGLKWITADTPGDRSEAKKGMIYCILGLVVVAVAGFVVEGLYCQTICTYGDMGC